MRKILKITSIVVASIFIILAASFLIIYIKYDAPIPKGTKGEEAENLAKKITTALNYKAYKNTNFLSWEANGVNYIWDKKNRNVEIKWNGQHLIFQQDNPNESIIEKPKNLSAKEKKALIAKAEKLFNNDSFWLIAPFKIFDKNTERLYVPATTTENASLLITYMSGGSTPGDTYQWFVDDNFIPIKYKMWVSIIPIHGLPATWENWKTSKTGVKLAHQKKIANLISFPMTNIKTWNIAK